MTPPKYLQQYLFAEALKEQDVFCDFETDHKHGQQKIGNLTFGLKFPRRYVDAIAGLDINKTYKYCFIGHINSRLGRDSMLEPFQGPHSYIRNSNYGRNPATKFSLTLDYYQQLAHSKFVLCPNHQGGEWYIHDWAWSYRFVETIFCKSIPIVFRSTPYGKFFVRDTFYLWNDDSHDLVDYDNEVEKNYQRALEYWTLQPNEIDQIKGQIHASQ